MRFALLLVLALCFASVAGGQVGAPGAMSFEVVERQGNVQTLNGLVVNVGGVEVRADVAETTGTTLTEFTLRDARLTLSPAVRRGMKVQMTIRGSVLKDLPVK